MYPWLIIHIFIFYIFVRKFQVKHLNNGFFLHRAERRIPAAQFILGHNPTTRAVNSMYTGWVSASTQLAQVNRHLHQAWRESVSQQEIDHITWKYKSRKIVAHWENELVAWKKLKQCFYKAWKEKIFKSMKGKNQLLQYSWHLGDGVVGESKMQPITPQPHTIRIHFKLSGRKGGTSWRDLNYAGKEDKNYEVSDIRKDTSSHVYGNHFHKAVQLKHWIFLI